MHNRTGYKQLNDIEVINPDSIPLDRVISNYIITNDIMPGVTRVLRACIKVVFDCVAIVDNPLFDFIYKNQYIHCFRDMDNLKKVNNTRNLDIIIVVPDDLTYNIKSSIRQIRVPYRVIFDNALNRFKDFVSKKHYINVKSSVEHINAINAISLRPTMSKRDFQHLQSLIDLTTDTNFKHLKLTFIETPFPNVMDINNEHIISPDFINNYFYLKLVHNIPYMTRTE